MRSSWLAEPRRRGILLLVRDSPCSVNEIAYEFQVSQQAVSQHLHVLKDAGLVVVHAEGQRRLYAVRPEGFAAVEQFDRSSGRRASDGSRPLSIQTSSWPLRRYAQLVVIELPARGRCTCTSPGSRRWSYWMGSRG